MVSAQWTHTSNPLSDQSRLTSWSSSLARLISSRGYPCPERHDRGHCACIVRRRSYPRRNMTGLPRRHSFLMPAEDLSSVLLPWLQSAGTAFESWKWVDGRRRWNSRPIYKWPFRVKMRIKLQCHVRGQAREKWRPDQERRNGTHKSCAGHVACLSTIPSVA